MSAMEEPRGAPAEHAPGRGLEPGLELVRPDDAEIGLERIIVRVRSSQPDEGWVTRTAATCTDEEFDRWARTRAQIEDEESHWPQPDREQLIRLLVQSGQRVYRLKAEVPSLPRPA